MADDNLAMIEFGAKIDKLVEGVEKIQGHIGGLKSHVEGLADNFKRLAEILGVAFTIEGIKHYIEAMAELGLQTERTMAMLGLSAEAVVQLGGVAKLTGTSMEGLTLSLERMSLNIQRSTRDAFNPVAQGMKVLNLNAKELIGLSADQYIDKLQEAVSRLAPGLNLTNALMAVGGRGVAQMLPLLTQSKAKYEEWKRAVDGAREGLAQAIPGMADTHVKLSLLELSAQSSGARIFTVLKPAIDWIVTGLTEWNKQLTTDKIRTYVGTVIDFTSNMLISIGMLFSGLNNQLDQTLSKLRSIVIGAAIGTAAGGLATRGNKAAAIMGGLFGALTAEQVHSWLYDPIGKGVDDLEGDVPEWAKKIQDVMTKLKLAMTGGGHDEHGAAKPQAAAIDEQMRQRIEMAVKLSDYQISVASASFERIKILDELGAAVFGMTELQKTQHLKIESSKRDQITISELQRQRDMWPLASKERLDAEIKLNEAVTKAGLDQLKQSGDILKERKKQFDDVLMTPMLNSWDSHLRGLLSKTESFKSAWKSILGDMIIEWIKMIEKKVATWVGAVFLEVTATQGGETAKTAAASEGMLARSAIAFAGALKSIGASIAETFAKLTAWFATFMGPAAPAAAAGVAAGVSALAIGMIPAAEQGAWNVRPGLFQLHAGETVLPAGAAAAFRAMAETGSPSGGGGVNVTFAPNISALDGHSVARVMPMLAKQFAQYLADNPSGRPRY